VAQPQMHFHHRRIAEVYYTMGTEEHLRAARKYYAAAVDMSNGMDVRALYGLVLVDARLKKFDAKYKGGGGGGGGSGGVSAGVEGEELGAMAAGRFLSMLRCHVVHRDFDPGLLSEHCTF